MLFGKFNQQIPMLDMVTALAVNGEILSFQGGCVQTDMNQNLGAVENIQADRMACFKHGVNSSIAGSIHLSFRGDDGDTVAQHAL